MEMTRPGVGEKLLSERSLSGDLLEKEHEKIDEQMRLSLQVKVAYCIDILLKRQWLFSHEITQNHLLTILRGKMSFYPKTVGPTSIGNQSLPLVCMSRETHFCMTRLTWVTLPKMQNIVPAWPKHP
jgi:hypothetical protein